jgi:hypothetical protein
MDIPYLLSGKYNRLQKCNIAERIKACLYVARSDYPIGTGIIAIIKLPQGFLDEEAGCYCATC